MTLRFSRNFWSERKSTAHRTAHESLRSAIRRYLAHAGSIEQSHDLVVEVEAPKQPQTSLRGNCSVFLPEGYEGNYPYPLVVWFHQGGADERELLEVMPQITTQNCIGLGIRGTMSHSSGTGYDWPVGASSIADFEEYLSSTVRSLRREYHIHSERIFPAGFGEGGAMALRTLFSRPEWFGGAAALGTPMTGGKKRVLARFRDLAGKRLLLSTGSRDRKAPAAGMLHLAHLLHTAGMEIETRVFDGGHELVPSALRRIDHWIMEGICAADRVA